MRVVTWNLWWRFGPWEARQAPIARILSELDADLVGLQEVWQAGTESQAHVLADRLGLHAAVGMSDGEPALGNAVLSRWPIAEAERIVMPDGYRSVLATTIDSPHGPIPFLTTHLSHRFDESAVRQQQIETLATSVASRRTDDGFPAVVTGDLNATPESDEIRMLTGRAPGPVAGLVFTDAWEVAGSADDPGWTWSGDNPYQHDTTWPRRRLDYVLVSWPRAKPVGNPQHCRVAGREAVDGVVASDHYAVVADLATG